MFDTFDFEPSLGQQLYLVAGVIALEYQKVFRAFNLGGLLGASPENRDFERRRRNWSSLVRRTFEGNPDLLKWHGQVNSRIGRLKDMRDSLIHANPSLNPFDDDGLVTFRMEYPDKRFRQRALAYQMWKQRKRGQKKDLQSAKWWAEDETFIQFSYTLEELVSGARSIPELNFEVMNISGQVQSLIAAEWRRQENAPLHYSPSPKDAPDNLPDTRLPPIGE